MEGCDGVAVVETSQPLVQSVKQIGPAARGFPRRGGVRSRGSRQEKERKEPMRTIAEKKFGFRVRVREPIQNLPRVNAYAGEIPAQTIGRIQSDFQSASITFQTSQRLRADRLRVARGYPPDKVPLAEKHTVLPAAARCWRHLQFEPRLAERFSTLVSVNPAVINPKRPRSRRPIMAGAGNLSQQSRGLESAEVRDRSRSRACVLRGTSISNDGEDQIDRLCRERWR